MCNFRGLLGGYSRIWGNLGCFRARRNFLASFGIGGTWRGRFAWVETSVLCFCETSGCFRGIRKLERLVWARKNLGLWRVWKLGGCF